MTDSKQPSKDTSGAPASFESRLAELEALVEALESGDLELAESLDRFKHGVELSASCRAMLDAAQQQVDTLLEAQTTDPAADASTDRTDESPGDTPGPRPDQ